MMRRFVSAVALMLFCCASSIAAPTEDAKFDPQQDLIGGARPARIIGKPGQRVYLTRTWDHDNCPSASAKCKSDRYLIPGDPVLVVGKKNGWSLIQFTLDKSSMVGGNNDAFVPTSRLRMLPAPTVTPPLSAWLGKWVYYTNEIDISRVDSKTLKVTGNAYYYTGGGSVNVGELDNIVKPQGNRLILGPDDLQNQYACIASFQWFGDYLFAKDNNNCGGHNVSFTGPYRKKRQ